MLFLQFCEPEWQRRGAGTAHRTWACLRPATRRAPAPIHTQGGLRGGKEKRMRDSLAVGLLPIYPFHRQPPARRRKQRAGVSLEEFTSGSFPVDPAPDLRDRRAFFATRKGRRRTPDTTPASKYAVATQARRNPCRAGAMRRSASALKVVARRGAAQQLRRAFRASRADDVLAVVCGHNRG